VSRNEAARFVPDGFGGAYVIRMGVRQDKKIDLLRLSPGLFEAFKDSLLCGGNPAVDQADPLAEDQVGVNKPLEGDARGKVDLKGNPESVDVFSDLHRHGLKWVLFAGLQGQSKQAATV
jgi:hypothetical protein